MTHDSQLEVGCRADGVLDLADCALEPIHTPGMIQPHGLLLVLEESGLTVSQASENSVELVDIGPCDLLDRPIDQLLGADQAAHLRMVLRGGNLIEANPTRLSLPAGPEGRAFTVLVHRVDRELVLEAEPIQGEDIADPQAFYHEMRPATARLQATDSEEALCQAATDEVRRITGYDRVMVYQFDADWHGTVIAESRGGRLASSYLGLHFPASDIPEQARRLYSINRLRSIPDARYTPARLVRGKTAVSGRPLDMSQCVLRSVSPVHLEYLRNMGVGATLTVSLLRNGKLWGLIACHHDQPRRICPERRLTCSFLGQIMESQLSMRADGAERAYRLQSSAIQVRFLDLIARAGSLNGLAADPTSVLDFVAARGAAIIQGMNSTLIGQTPDESEIPGLIDLIAGSLDQGVFATDSLAACSPPAARFKDVASGMLALEIARERGEYLLWFRPEQVRVVHWAGDPDKPAIIEDGTARVHPRTSFDLWKLAVTLHSKRWQPCEVAAAIELKKTFRNLSAGDEQLRASRRRQDAVAELGRRALGSTDTRSRFRDAIELVSQSYEVASDAVVTLDPSSWRITSANPSAIAMFRAKDEADFISRAPWQYLSKRQVDGRNPADLVKTIGGAAIREGFRFLEWTCARVDATEFPSNMLLTRIECAGETLLQATVRDISEEKRTHAEREMRLLRQEGVNLLQQSLLTTAPLGQKFGAIADTIVRLFDVDFCRIWLNDPGDPFERGRVADVPNGSRDCRERNPGPRLAASSGRYSGTHRDIHGDVPLSDYEIGELAIGEELRVTIDDVANDPRIGDRGPASQLDLQSFAGFQLRAAGGKTLGVLAVFARHPISPDQHAMLDGLSSTAALVVQQDTAEQELEDSRNRYNALFDGSLSLVYISDFHGRVIDVNDAALDRLGYGREEIPTLDMTALLDEDQLALARETIREIRETGNQRNPTEFRLRRKDGTDVYVQTTGSAVFSKGRMAAIQTIAIDITERKLEEAKVQQLLTELDRSNKELGQFAYVASHDLQEPLRTVSGYTQLLARRYRGRLDANADEYIAGAVNAVTRMQTLIKDLLAYSRVGSRVKEFEPTDSGAVLALALADLKSAIEESGATVSHGPLPVVMADRLQLGQLFQNLIGNAIKYHSDEPPRVDVSAEQKGHEWVFAVKDNGIGIDPQYAKRIFVIFQRLHTREAYPGTGIGLAICKKIAERHNGRIWMESQVGSGTTFYFTIYERRKTPR